MMNKLYSFLVLLLRVNFLNSVSEKDYYQYVINEDAQLPCNPAEDCDNVDNWENTDLGNGENFDLDYDDDEEAFDTLYDEQVDIVPYDALNDAFQELSVQRNLLKPRKTRSSGPYSRSDYRNVEETYRKYMSGDFPGGKFSSLRHNPIARKTICRDEDCKMRHNRPQENELAEEFYRNGVTKNDLDERKKLELIRHTFADEKLKLLQTDKFIHQIVSGLGELENFEFESNEETVNSIEENENQGESTLVEVPSFKTSIEDGHKSKDNAQNSIDSVKRISGISYRRSKESGHNKKETLHREFHDFDDAEEALEQSPDDEEINTDFDDFMPDKLTNDFSESFDEEQQRKEQRILSGKTRISEEIIDDPEVGQFNNDDKFVVSKHQYESYLKSVIPSLARGKSLDEHDVYNLKTRTTKSKRSDEDDDLSDFERPRFDDIPKVHELPGQHVDKLWNEYKKKYKKNYMRKSIEAKKRQHWAANLHKIHQHNEEARRGVHSYTLRDNHLTDLHPLHYLREMTRLTHSRIRRHLTQVLKSTMNDSVSIPDHFDWRSEGFVTPDWNQEDCGACYAFSVTSAIQGQLFKKTSELEDLSIQQVVDCSIISGNLGCAGGSLRNSLNYVQFAGGLMKADEYPYKGKQSICKFRKPAVAVPISSWSVLPPQDEHALKVTLATVGPLAVSINASPHTFQLYSSGIYDDDACTSDYVNHAMLLVGYTRRSWILKNWWSENWGDKGYMYLKRGHNRCGIANYAVYALI